MVHPDVWEEVPDKHVGEAVGFTKHGQDTDGNSKTKITE